MNTQHLPTRIALLLLASSLSWAVAAAAATHGEAAAPAAKASTTQKAAADHATTTLETDKPEPVIDLKKAIREQLLGKKKLTLVISDKPERTGATSAAAAKPAAHSNAKSPAAADHAAAPTTVPAVAHPVAVAAKPRPTAQTVVVNPRASRDYIRAKAAALTGRSADSSHDSSSAPMGGDQHGGAHWSYSGATGPQAWGQLNPEFAACATGKRQSPINIEESYTLQGPAEPLQFNYMPSNGTVVNNGHTIQVDVQGSNTLSVRGSTFSLLQIHFHSPSEEQVNYRNFAMVAHLVHKNAEGQLAVVAVLLDPGEASALIDKIWTYMPLDVNDQVRMPPGLLNLKELLPQDQRYYQFIGSLTTPPCTEGVLWMVLKQPAQISAGQLRLFQQLYPNNARPVQPVNSRPVRSAM
ncbi:MAG: carbonate dehydratase [Comamonadaceae bacterium CG_4_9_14_0_8_um_filter_60_18]|nr:MAG: carbonate dehydratase [Comamonadaceae bacterium CG_4_9_14_0_8_um_filter_60_18]